MNYAVDWTPEALSQLTALWLEHAPERTTITLAQSEIDQVLARDPVESSQAVSEGLRMTQVGPIKVQLEIAETARVVTVVSVRFLA